MSQTDKNMLILEAKQQTEALLRLGIWRRAALSLMSLGVLLSFWSFVIQFHILRGVLGILLTLTAGAAAALISIGKRNGQKNVEHILQAAERL